jgi:hypothetical protein
LPSAWPAAASPRFALGLLLWGLPIALLGIWPNRWLALLLLGLVGVGNTLVDVAGQTLLQRAVAEEVLARAFGVLQSLLLGTLALGAAVAPSSSPGWGSARRCSPPGCCCRCSPC